MGKKTNRLLDSLKNQVKLSEYWTRPAPYVQPKITNVTNEEMTVEKFISTVASHEFIEGGRQVPNRKPNY